MGDSYTHGSFVDTEDSWPEQLEDTLNTKSDCTNYNKFEVINLGVYGYDIQYAVERYKRRGVKYDPDLVIWFLKDDDFYEIAEVMRQNEKYYQEEMKKTGGWDMLNKRKDYPPAAKM